MNSVKAVTKLVRISPRKARLAAGLIRCLSYVQAKNQLAHSNLKAGRLLMKTLDSAAANAAHNLSIGQELLSVLEVRVDAGPTMKRSKSKNKGGQHPIMKRTSHFSVIVGTK